MYKHAPGGRLQAGPPGTDRLNRESEGEVRARDEDPHVRSTLKEALRGTYRIVKRIGEGGMGDLYLATHEELGGKWAVKVLGRDLVEDPEVVERFVTEARIGAELQHPNIVKVFHIGQAGRFRYLVMNYVEGEDLTARIERSESHARVGDCFDRGSDLPGPGVCPRPPGRSPRPETVQNSN